MPRRPVRCRGERARRRTWVAALSLAALLASPVPALAEGPPPAARAADIAFDLIILRPMGLGELVFGVVCFVPVALFAGKSIKDPWEHFVVGPFEDTFTRPLGEWEEDF